MPYEFVSGNMPQLYEENVKICHSDGSTVTPQLRLLRWC
jgi:hypothetical protein